MSDILKNLGSGFWLIVFVLIVGSIIWSHFTRKRKFRKKAQSIQNDMNLTFHSGFRWASVELGSLQHLDIDFYEENTEALVDLGCHVVGDVEYLHVTEGNPSARTCVRLLVHREEDCNVALYNVRIRGWQKWLLKLMGHASDHRVVEVQSVLSNGCFVMTNNTGDSIAMTQPKEIFQYKYPITTSAELLLKMHQDNLSKLCAQLPESPVPIKINSLEDIIHYEEVQHNLNADYRSSQPVLTEEELVKFGSGLSQSDREILAQEFKKNND